MKKWLVALLGVTLRVSLAVSVLACASTNPNQEIVWADRAKGQVMFIPGDLLNQTDWSKLPLDEVHRSTLEGATRRPERLEELKRTLGREESLCTKYPQPISQEPLPTAKPLRTYLEEIPTSLVGIIESVVPGWSIREGEAAQAVYVKVEEVLQTEGASFNEDPVIIYMARHGSFYLHGTKICRDSQPGFQEPREGDRVLLIGQFSSTNSKFFFPTFIYPVENGTIRYQPYLDVQRFEVLDLNSWLKQRSLTPEKH
jgi:hypothetical protein